MSNFDTAKWFKNQYLKEHKINENEYDDEDIVIYDGEEHVIMSHDGNMVYIRPLEDSAILGKRDVIKVPVRALAYKSDLDKMFDKYEKMQTNEGFKVGDKVTYLGHPAVVTATKEYNDRDFVSVSYDKGNGATKARMILVKSGDVKAVKEDMNEEESNMPTQDQVDKFFALTQNEMHYLNSKPVMGQEKTFNKMEIEPWDEYDLSNWNALVRKAKENQSQSSSLIGRMGDRSFKENKVEEDMNDPVLMKARAAKMADEKEMARQAALDKKYGSSFMDKLEAEIDLKNELQDLKDERAQLTIDMEQEAEPEGGEVANRYGSRLNDIDDKIAEIRNELEDLRMYESINENREAIKETFRFIKENNPEFTNEEIKAELKEIKELGNQLNEELCAKGKAYRKRRMAAGEKSSAYLSGRAVKVCKGQMSGKKKKK